MSSLSAVMWSDSLRIGASGDDGGGRKVRPRVQGTRLGLASQDSTEEQLPVLACPGVVDNAAEPLSLFGRWREAVASRSLPVDYITRDGQEQLVVSWMS